METTSRTFSKNCLGDGLKYFSVICVYLLRLTYSAKKSDMDSSINVVLITPRKLSGMFFWHNILTVVSSLLFY